MINYGKQSIGIDEQKAINEALKSDYLTQGPKIEEFEGKLAEYCGSKYAVAVCNGTAALHLANLVIGTKKDDDVITTPISFLATSNSIIYSGGNPKFCDVQNSRFTINPDEVKLGTSKNNLKGIIPVHLGGVICDMDRLKEIARINNLWIIEDACHAFGGVWIDKNGTRQKVGNCSHSDMTTFSFHPVKHITTGEGGAITTNSNKLYKKLIKLRSHGMIKDSTFMEKNYGLWYYEMHDLGYNYRMTDIQAALGIEQLKKSDRWIKIRRDLVRRYDQAFKDIREITPQDHPDKNGGYSYHLYIIQCERRGELYHFLRQKGVFTQVHYIPIHLQPYYKNNYGYDNGDFPIAEEYYNNALSLPLYPLLSSNDQELVINLIKEFYGEKNIK